MATQAPTQFASSAAPGTMPGFAAGLMSGSANPSANAASIPASIPAQSQGEAASSRAGLAPHAGISLGEMPSAEETASLRLSPPLARLPVGLEVVVPVREFRVHHLLALLPGEVIETQWGHGEDLPLSAGDVQLAWSEFEVVDSRLAVRVTRLA